MPRGSETILVVEDEPVLRKMIVDFLESTGYKVLNAESASEAVGHVRLFGRCARRQIRPAQRCRIFAKAFFQDEVGSQAKRDSRFKSDGDG